MVAGAIRLKAVSFSAYRGRHPQSAKAVLVGFLIHSMYCDCHSHPRYRNAPPYIDHSAQARLRGSRSDKTKSGLLFGLSREASTKRQSGISRISDSLHVLRLTLSPPIPKCASLHRPSSAGASSW